MEEFIDREGEMQYLQREYQRAEASFVVIYGRRRVGKTALINAFCKNKPALYFLATEEMEIANRNAFRIAVAEHIEDSLLLNATVNDWGLLFEALCKKPQTERLVIVIDEFQYIGKANPAFPSVLQKIWDTFLNKQNVMLIVCGSLISMMMEQTLAYGSPLYGRRTGQIRLGQVPFQFYNEFYPTITDTSKLIEYYAVTGGVPKYIELFKNEDDVFSAIEKNVIERQSFLYEEPMFLLKNEVQEVGSYFSIIKAIAAGNRKLGHIASVLEMKATSLTKPLQVLSNLDIVEREVPVTEDKPENSKKGLYKIKDNFLAFWFRFIYPNRSFIEAGHPEIAMKRIKASFRVNHAAYVYEDVCRASMWTFNAEGQLPFLFDRVGRWWGNKDIEIDIVGLDSTTGENIIFGECKYTEAPAGVDVLQTLQEKAKKVQWGSESRKESFILFSAHGFSVALKEMAQNNENIFLVDGLSMLSFQTLDGTTNK